MGTDKTTAVEKRRAMIFVEKAPQCPNYKYVDANYPDSSKTYKKIVCGLTGEGCKISKCPNVNSIIRKKRNNG